MSENIQKKTAKHLMNIIKQRIGTVPNFALLLGAGCSCSSGVKSAKDMIIELRYKLYENLKIEKGYEEWLKENDWYNDEKEYQILFEKVYDERAQRRIYVEECIGSATPSWGYIYLANLIGNNYFNVIFTTNFDDLINEACFMYAGYKPIICAHDSSISDVRVTSARSKIIKLHGDFLYDNIKNTLKETETLETNTKEKLIQFGREYGLIVIGYGGNDDSIMDILNMMIKSKDFFPHGVYWCIRKNDKINKKVLNFLQKDRTYLIEIEGFDEFMAELNNYIHLDLPEIVRNPYLAISKTLNKFIIPDGDSIKNQYIKRDAQILEEKLKDFERVISTKKIEEFDKFVPYEFLCNYSFSNNKYEDVIMYYEKAEILGNVAEDTNVKYLMSLYNTFKLDKSKTIIDKFVKDYPDNVYGYQITSLYYQIINDEKNSLEYINISIDKSKNDTIKNAMLFYKARLLQYYDKLEDSIKINEEIVKKEPDEEANKLIKLSTLKELKGIDYITKDMSELIPKIESGYNLACAYAIIENKEYSFRILEEEIKKDVRYKILAKYDPDFKIYKDDEKFNKIIS